MTDEIAPPAWSPRIISLCRHLSSLGWHCAVFSDRLPGVAAFDNDDAEWHQTQYYGKQQSRMRYIADKVFGARERHFTRYVERTVDVSSFDLIFCSTCYYFPLQTAGNLARKYQKPYAVDLRDIAEQWGNVPYMTHRLPLPEKINKAIHKTYERHFLRIRNKVLKDAVLVTTISKWHVGILKQYNANTQLIYNGYDAEDFRPEDVRESKFRISYAGRIYDTRFRDPRLLFQAVGEMLTDGTLPEKDVELSFRIDTSSIQEIQALALHYGVAQVCDIGPYIPKQNISDFLHRSSVLLVLTCLSTDDGPHGILGTKFYEALGVEKPVLCVRSDEDALADVIHETGAGIAASSAEELKTFLLDKFEEWKKKGFTRQHTDEDIRQRFTRQYESGQFEHYFRNIAGL